MATEAEVLKAARVVQGAVAAKRAAAARLDKTAAERTDAEAELGRANLTLQEAQKAFAELVGRGIEAGPVSMPTPSAPATPPPAKAAKRSPAP